MTCPRSRSAPVLTRSTSPARLVKLPEIELTLLVQDPAQAKGMTGRVVTAGVVGR